MVKRWPWNCCLHKVNEDGFRVQNQPSRQINQPVKQSNAKSWLYADIKLMHDGQLGYPSLRQRGPGNSLEIAPPPPLTLPSIKIHLFLNQGTGAISTFKPVGRMESLMLDWSWPVQDRGSHSQKWEQTISTVWIIFRTAAYISHYLEDDSAWWEG